MHGLVFIVVLRPGNLLAKPQFMAPLNQRFTGVAGNGTKWLLDETQQELTMCRKV
jgi:hypothetical protein